MSITLNFQKKHLTLLESTLSEFQKIPVTSQYEHARFKDKDNVIVVYSSGKTVIQGKKEEEAKKNLLEKLGLTQELVLGFDESGRGENFGPFVIAGVLGDSNLMRENRDSKKTKKINEKFENVTKNALAIASFSLSAEFVDRLRKKGFNLNEIESKIIDKTTEVFLELEEKPRIVVDGNPMKTTKKEIEFIPKADDLEPIVGAASISAKFLRENSKDSKKRETWKQKSA